MWHREVLSLVFSLLLLLTGCGRRESFFSFGFQIEGRYRDAWPRFKTPRTYDLSIRVEKLDDRNFQPCGDVCGAVEVDDIEGANADYI